MFPMETEAPKTVFDVEASGKRWVLVAANEEFIDSIVYKAVVLKRIRREDAKEADSQGMGAGTPTRRSARWH